MLAWQMALLHWIAAALFRFLKSLHHCKELCRIKALGTQQPTHQHWCLALAQRAITTLLALPATPSLTELVIGTLAIGLCLAELLGKRLTTLML
jgi:hypothetical protein